MSERVLITGAGGFIGGRIAEVLHCSGRFTVRAGIRRWSTAARIARFPMDIVVVDVMDKDGIRAAMQDVDLVVNCSKGAGPVIRESIHHLLEAAQDAGIRRVVHMSSIAVYGEQAGVLDESSPFTRSGNDYGDSKIEAEEACWKFADAGLPVVVLRPTIVYGPFSDLWTVEFAERMATRRWMLPREYCDGTCNLVYIDDLVAAVIRALTSRTGINEAYNINGPELDITWNRYFDALNGALGLPPLEPQHRTTARVMTALMQPVRTLAKTVLARFQEPILELYKSNELAKRVMKRAESMIRSTPTTDEYAMYSMKVSFPTAKAERLLGYRPTFRMDEGVALSAGWLKHHGFVGEPG